MGGHPRARRLVAPNARMVPSLTVVMAPTSPSSYFTEEYGVGPRI
jgi:hypothetical protein